jgi:hypothetical protein
VAGGALIVLNALLVFLQIGDMFSLFVSNLEISLLGMFDVSLSDFDSFLINIIIGGFIAATSYIVYSMPDKSKITGMFIIALSMISVLVGNGFLVGGVLAILGGILAVIGR